MRVQFFIQVFPCFSGIIQATKKRGNMGEY
nr:MAG TPA: hypothetical protein [Caudoviricetes sp.]